MDEASCGELELVSLSSLENDFRVAYLEVLFFPQGDVGPPGPEGEQGQEGIRVSDRKQAR